MARSRIVNLANFQQFTAINVLSDPGHIGGPVLIPSCAEVILLFSLPGAKGASIVCHGRYTGAFAGTPAQCDSIFTALKTGAAATALAGHWAPQTVFGGVQLRDVAVANAPLITSTAAGLVGTGTAPAVPNETALVITKRTAATGRANRGRMYMPGWSSASVASDNTAIPALMTDLQAWANTVQNAFNAAGYQMVIGQPARASYVGHTGTVHPARPAGSVTVSALQVRDNHFDSQRRRGLK
jgi:hypothetical protein